MEKDEDYISISPDKDFENIDLNMIIDNNLENIFVSNTDKKTNEAEPKMKQGKIFPLQHPKKNITE